MGKAKTVLESLVRPKLGRNVLSKHRDESGEPIRDVPLSGC